VDEGEGAALVGPVAGSVLGKASVQSRPTQGVQNLSIRPVIISEGLTPLRNSIPAMSVWWRVTAHKLCQMRNELLRMTKASWLCEDWFIAANLVSGKSQ
jgi:hypothetical protein